MQRNKFRLVSSNFHNSTRFSSSCIPNSEIPHRALFVRNNTAELFLISLLSPPDICKMALFNSLFYFRIFFAQPDCPQNSLDASSPLSRSPAAPAGLAIFASSLEHWRQFAFSRRACWGYQSSMTVSLEPPHLSGTLRRNRPRRVGGIRMNPASKPFYQHFTNF